MRAATLVAAAGGFEANIEWLKQYWGDGGRQFPDPRHALQSRHGAQAAARPRRRSEIGDPTQCHAVAIDARAPKFDGGIITRLDCVVFGIVVNKHAQRFYDEGEDIWPKRYAIWGRLVAAQPDQIAYIMFDASVADAVHALALSADRGAPSIRELAGKLTLDPDALEATVDGLQRRGAARHLRPHDPRRLPHRGPRPAEERIGRGASRRAPFYAYPVRPGITFTYLARA